MFRFRNSFFVLFVLALVSFVPSALEAAAKRTLKITVKSQKGTLNGAQVQAFKAGTLVGTTVTTSKGLATLKLKPDLYTVRVLFPDDANRPVQTELAANLKKKNFSKTVVLNGYFYERGNISGLVMNAEGQPLDGATVNCTGVAPVTTDSAGRYRLELLPPGTCHLAFSANGFKPMSADVTVAVRETAPADVNLEVDAPVQGNLTGTVTSQYDGSAIGGATVIINGQTANTAADGTYTVTAIEPGTYSVTYTANGHKDGTVSVTIIGGQTATTNVTLAPKEGSVAGLLTDGTTQLGLSGVQVTFSLNGVNTVVVTDPTGNYVANSLYPGAYSVRIESYGYEVLAINVTVGLGENLSKDLSLSRLPVPTLTATGTWLQNGPEQVYGLSVVNNILYALDIAGTKLFGYSATTGDPTGQWAVGQSNPRFLSYSATAGKFLVSKYGKGTWVSNDGTVSAAPVLGYVGTASLPDGRIAVVDSSNLHLLDINNNLTTYEIGEQVNGTLAVTADQRYIFIGGDQRLSVASLDGTVVRSVNIGFTPISMGTIPGTNTLLLGDEFGRLYVVDKLDLLNGSNAIKQQLTLSATGYTASIASYTTGRTVFVSVGVEERVYKLTY